jgi:hypothetical protein
MVKKEYLQAIRQGDIHINQTKLWVMVMLPMLNLQVQFFMPNQPKSKKKQKVLF